MDIKGICEALGITQGEFAKKVGVSTQTLHNWTTGKSEPTTNALKTISKTFDVSPTYLLTGEGEMFSGSSQQKPAADINQEILKEIIIGLERGLNDTQTTLSPEVKAEIVLLYYNDYVKQTKQIDNIIDFREVIGKDILRTIKTLKIV